MIKKVIGGLLLILIFSVNNLHAQYESIVTEGEFGISAGLDHYFGDLDTDLKLNRPKMACGIFFRKQFGNYVALRVAGHYAFLAYSDVYNTNNEYELRRNLSFNTSIFELTAQGDFNFFKFVPGDPDHRFTPYITFGLGVFSYDPYAYYQGKKYYLRPLGTEGEGYPGYPKPYGSMAMCFPLGVGVKYALTDKINVGFEIVHRLTTTDYIDDVSKTYVNPAIFGTNPDGSTPIAAILSDRSFETGTPIGFVNGTARQRGNPKQNDTYVMAEFTVSFNITSYRCPSAN